MVVGDVGQDSVFDTYQAIAGKGGRGGYGVTPYFSYIKNNKRLFRTATENAAVLGKDKSYDRMFRHVFTPILDRYGVLQQDRPYIMAFYIRGLMVIISEWLKNDCADSITYITGVIQQCVKMPQSETMNDI